MVQSLTTKNLTRQISSHDNIRETIQTFLAFLTTHFFETLIKKKND